MSREPEAIVAAALGVLEQVGAVQADAILVASESIQVRVRGEEVEFVKQSRENVLGLRGFITGDAGLQQALTSTSDLSPEAVRQVAEKAVELARATAGDPHAGLPDAPSTQALADLKLHDPADRPVKVEDRIDAARVAERAARAVDPRILNSEGSDAGSQFSNIVYGTSKGFIGSYASATHSLSCEPIAQVGDERQRDYWYAVSRSLSDLGEPEEIGRIAGARAIARLGAHPVDTCEVPVIFEQRVAASLLRQLFQCTSGYAIYRGASFLVDKLGEAIAAPSVTVIDDGTIPAGLGSKPFDAEGLPTRRNVIVSGGVLENYLLDSYSARKLGAQSTGSAARGVGSGPSVAPTNLWLEPGTQSLEEIVAATDRGLLVTELIGAGFNPVTGDYSHGAAGHWIEGGARLHPVEEVTIAGNLGAMLCEVDHVGSDLLWLGRIGSPSLRISRMTVAGR